MTDRPGATPPDPLPAPPTHEELVAAVRRRGDLPRSRRRRQHVDVTGIDPSLTGWADLARTDLAARLHIDAASIEVERLGPVTWSDAACGCPDPDLAQVQVPVDGAYAALVADGVRFHYHGGGRLGPFLCPD